MRRYLMVLLLMFLPAMSTADPPAEPVSRTLMVAGLERTFHLSCRSSSGQCGCAAAASSTRSL